MGIMGLSQNGSGNSQENLEGVFYPLAYKRENNNKKVAPVLQESTSGPLLSKCQTVAWVASLRDPVEMALFDFSSLPLAPWAQPFSPSTPHPAFVQSWYADRLTLKRGSHGDEKGPLTSPGTRQIPMQGLRAILKSCPRIHRQSTFTYELFSPLNKDTQVLSAILQTHTHRAQQTWHTGDKQTWEC